MLMAKSTQLMPQSASTTATSRMAATMHPLPQIIGSPNHAAACTAPSKRKKKKRKSKNKTADRPQSEATQWAVSPRSGQVANHSQSNDRIWSSLSNSEERQRIHEFWLQLGMDERRALVEVEKEAVLRKMKEQQRHSCNCSICGKKRMAIEDELDVLYDAYYEELEQDAHYQQQTHSQNGDALALRPGLITADSMYNQDLDPVSHLHAHSHVHPHPRMQTYEDDEHDEHDEDEDDEEDDYDYEQDDEDDDDDASQTDQTEVVVQYTSNSVPRHGHIARTSNLNHGEHLNFGNSLTVKGGILTVADDLLKNDGKKFLDMMERLAERRIQKEEAVIVEQGNEYYDEDEDEDEDEVFEDEDDEDSRTEEQRMEEGRRMFQIFAARMFEQRVLAAYREKVAQERQQRLIQELEEEERLQQERELKKQRDRERKKDKKMQLKKQKEEERLALEAKKKAEEEAALAEKKRLAELELQKQEERRNKEEKDRRKREEERARKEAEERLRKDEEERLRKVEEERLRKEEEERLRKENEERLRKENEERLRKEKDERLRREEERYKKEQEELFKIKEEERLRQEKETRQRLQEEQERAAHEEKERQSLLEAQQAAMASEEITRRMKQAAPYPTPSTPIAIEPPLIAQPNGLLDTSVNALTNRMNDLSLFDASSPFAPSLAMSPSRDAFGVASPPPHGISFGPIGYHRQPPQPYQPVERSPTPIAPIGPPQNGRHSLSYSPARPITSPPTLRTHPERCASGSEHSFFSNFLFGESRMFHPEQRSNPPVDQRFSNENANLNWTNGWTASTALSDHVHGKLFGDVLADRETTILERSKAAYRRLDEISQKYLHQAQFHPLVDLHRIMNYLFQDHQPTDMKELYETLTSPAAALYGFQCEHHPQHGIIVRCQADDRGLRQPSPTGAPSMPPLASSLHPPPPSSVLAPHLPGSMT